MPTPDRSITPPLMTVVLGNVRFISTSNAPAGTPPVQLAGSYQSFDTVPSHSSADAGIGESASAPMPMASLDTLCNSRRFDAVMPGHPRHPKMSEG